MRKRLQLAFMPTRTTTVATSLLFLPSALFSAIAFSAICLMMSSPARAWADEGDGVPHMIATDDHGRKIYVNDDAPAQKRVAVPQPKRTLVCPARYRTALIGSG